MRRDEIKVTPRPASFAVYGGLAALGVVGVLYGIFAQREVVAVVGLVFVGFGQLNIGRLQERKEWISRKT